jgi:hypothetical protein
MEQVELLERGPVTLLARARRDDAWAVESFAERAAAGVASSAINAGMPGAAL